MPSRRVIRSALLGFLAGLLLAPQAGKAAPDQETVVVRDVHYGEILFYFYQQEYFPAIVRLLAAREAGQLAHHDAEAELLLGGLWLSYGHHLRAADIFERLLAESSDPSVRDRTWFFLAKIRDQRGWANEAREALAKIDGSLPDNLEGERTLLQARLHIEAGEYDRAAALLDAWDGDPGWGPYARFNLGVALVADGRLADGAAVLDALGTRPARGEEQEALRDKANLALGYAHLQNAAPAAARPVLARVRLSGPFSNKALLGTGWADAESGDFRRALVPWMELTARNLLDPAVQESLLAIPYAMASLDATSHAADRYLAAIEAYDGEAARLEEAIRRIGDGRLVAAFLDSGGLDTSGWSYRLERLPDGIEARYLWHLLATHEFQEALKNYRDLAWLARNLEEGRASIAVFRSMLDTRKLGYDQRLPGIEARLASVDTGALVDRKLALDARLNDIEQRGDSLALATKVEFAMWDELAALERQPALAADMPEARDARDKVRLMKGVLQWDLDRRFKERLWRLRRDLRVTGQALVETERGYRSVTRSLETEPDAYAGFDARVESLAPRIDALAVRVQAALARQGAFLEAIAVDELRAQKERLDTYTVQARFALATIYDRASTFGDLSP